MVPIQNVQSLQINSTFKIILFETKMRILGKSKRHYHLVLIISVNFSIKIFLELIELSGIVRGMYFQIKTSSISVKFTKHVFLDIVVGALHRVRDEDTSTWEGNVSNRKNQHNST